MLTVPLRKKSLGVRRGQKHCCVFPVVSLAQICLLFLSLLSSGELFCPPQKNQRKVTQYKYFVTVLEQFCQVCVLCMSVGLFSTALHLQYRYLYNFTVESHSLMIHFSCCLKQSRLNSAVVQLDIKVDDILETGEFFSRTLTLGSKASRFLVQREKENYARNKNYSIERSKTVHKCCFCNINSCIVPLMAKKPLQTSYLSAFQNKCFLTFT